MLVTDSNDKGIYECHSWAETVVCEGAEVPLDTFFIPWEWVAPGVEF